jgi:hypothetical protein
MAWGQCYDRYFWQFGPIFGQKIGDFLGTANVMIIFSTLMNIVLVKFTDVL